MFFTKTPQYADFSKIRSHRYLSYKKIILTALVQMIGPEALRQQLAQSETGPLAILTADNDRYIVIGKFPDALTAPAARGAEKIAARRDSDRPDFAAASPHHGGDSAGFGTAALRVGCIFDINA
jgi:hypothetical protein